MFCFFLGGVICTNLIYLDRRLPNECRLIFFESIDSGVSGLKKIEQIVGFMNGQRCKEYAKTHGYHMQQLIYLNQKC